MEPVSFIIRHKNEPLNLVATLKSMVDNGPLINGDEIIVCDDGSTRELKSMCCESIASAFASEIVFRNGGMRMILSPDMWPQESDLCLPAPQSGPQAMCDLGAHYAKNDWLCFMDAHMAFAPGWRDFPVDKVPEAEERWMAPLWRAVPRETWQIDPEAEPVWNGTRWHLQQARHGRLSVFNFDHVPIETRCLFPPVPMAGIYFIHADLYRRVGGFRLTPGNHGMELIMTLKTFMATGKPPATLFTLNVGHVNTMRPQTVDGIRAGLVNGARAVAVLDGWESAREWVRGWPESLVREDVLADLRSDKEALSKEHFRLKPVWKYTFDQACAWFCMHHPREISGESARVVSTAPGIKRYQVRGGQVTETTGGCR